MLRADFESIDSDLKDTKNTTLDIIGYGLKEAVLLDLVELEVEDSQSTVHEIARQYQAHVLKEIENNHGLLKTDCRYSHCQVLCN